MQCASINNYWGHPFYLGGTRSDGTTEYSELSYLILDVFDKLSIPTPKIQLKIARNTPEKLLNNACDMIRRGNSQNPDRMRLQRGRCTLLPYFGLL